VTLDTPVPVLQNQSELAELIALYRDRKPKRTLEVGTYHGGTLYHWLRHAPRGATVVSVDSYTVPGVDNRHLYQGWVPPHVFLHVIQGDSRDPHTVERAAEYGPYQWAFIDADHSYEAVKDDWENYGPLVDAGGVVCFHDINMEGEGVPRLWWEIRQGHKTAELVGEHEPGEAAWGLGPDTPWGGIGIVYK